MTATELVVYVFLVVGALFVGRAAVYAFWWTIGKYKVLKAGPRPLGASRHLLWREPGPIEASNPGGHPGGVDGAPLAPFHFIEEHLTGSQPCVSVRDGRDRTWRVKWGDEVRSETFAVRCAWSCGYFVEITYFVPEGTIVDTRSDLKRARACIEEQSGRFNDARFELDDPSVKKFFEEHSWSWNDNPFVGTPQLSGLKIVVMLLSNWDTKDRRDVARGSNTAIFEYRGRGRRREAHYLLSDWGGSMGRWGETIATRGRWDPAGFREQTPQFVTGVKDGCVTFGYSGQRTADIAHGITVAHVRWFAPYLDRLSVEFLTAALLESGATADEASQFAHDLLQRIRRLGEVVEENQTKHSAR